MEEPEEVEVRIWNDTVANLTLMALGTSAPEILLSTIEIVGNDFKAGELGPGSIVGSAAFNLMGITAVCIAAIPGTESRQIKGINLVLVVCGLKLPISNAEVKVFAVSTVFSILAYLWLILVLMGTSKDEVNGKPALKHVNNNDGRGIVNIQRWKSGKPS